MSDPAFIPQAAEAVLVALYDRELQDLVRNFPSTASGLTDDIFATVTVGRIEDVLSPDVDPAKATYRIRLDTDLLTLADQENDGENAILAKLRNALLSDDGTGLPLDPFSAFWLIPSASNTDTTIDADGRRARRITSWWGVTAAS